MNCRHCQTPLRMPFVDLGAAPPSNAYLTADDLLRPEKWYPLRVLVCESCWLVQTEDFAQADELFNEDYAYFSGFSSSWLEHSRKYVAAMVERFGLNPGSHVVEVAANDGYLLQHVKECDIPCLGIEPTASTARAAREKGIEIVEDFFGVSLAQKLADEGRSADLIAANNVLAHVPDINDFVRGFAILLKADGVATFEFPHLLQLVKHCQFDTIYHEHFSYLSLTAVSEIFRACGLTVVDVELLTTHGGSLRVFARRSDSFHGEPSSNVVRLLDEERHEGVATPEFYAGFQDRAESIKNEFLRFLLQAESRGETVWGYGAAAKGNTLLNFAGVRPDLLATVVDRNPAKQGRYLPGSRIPVGPVEMLERHQVDHLVILPWNLATEVAGQLSKGAKRPLSCLTAIPEIRFW